jgi:general secretion pathway protein K
MVILLVLGMLLLVVVFSIQLADASLALRNVEHRVRIKEMSYQVARSAVELAIALIKVDDIDVDSARDSWALGTQRLGWEGRDLFLEIRDEESRFPLRKLPLELPAPPESQPYAQALERFLNRAGLGGPLAVATLQDWMDSDEDVRSQGAEQGSYARTWVKNGPLDDLDELQHIQGWLPPQLPPPPPLDPSGQRLEEFKPILQGAGPPGTSSTWQDWMSIYSTGKVNVNTAPAEVLACLDPAMTDSVVTELIALRSQNVLESEQDLKKIPGIDQDLAFRLGKVCGFQSHVFRVRVIVTSEDTPLEMEAMLERKSQKEILVRYWRAR